MSRIGKLVGLWLAATLCLSVGVAVPAAAQEEIKIGLIYPLTGAAASTGLELKQAAELAADIVNNATPNLNLPLASTAGLPNMKGAKIKLIFADHQGNPQVGAT
jgi:branched-chain amino acid transport system substrate-binding protein